MLRSADRHGIVCLVESEQDHRLDAEERGADERGDLGRGEGPEVAEAGSDLRRRLGEEVEPAGEVVAHGARRSARRTTRRRSSPAAPVRTRTAGRPRGSRRPAPTAATAASRRRTGGSGVRAAGRSRRRGPRARGSGGNRSGSGSGSAARRRPRRSGGSTARRTRTPGAPSSRRPGAVPGCRRSSSSCIPFRSID